MKEEDGIKVESRLFLNHARLVFLSFFFFFNIWRSVKSFIPPLFMSIKFVAFRDLLKSVYTRSLLLYPILVIILSFFGLLLGFQSDARGCGRHKLSLLASQRRMASLLRQ